MYTVFEILLKNWIKYAQTTHSPGWQPCLKVSTTKFLKNIGFAALLLDHLSYGRASRQQTNKKTITRQTSLSSVQTVIAWYSDALEF